MPGGMQGGPKTPTSVHQIITGPNLSTENLGLVVSVDSLRMTATILLGRENVLEDIPFDSPVGPDGDGIFAIPCPGWHAIVSRDSGFPSISRFVPMPHSTAMTLDQEDGADEWSKAVSSWLSVTGSQKIYRTTKGKGRSYRAQRPHDLLPGDMGMRTREGSMVAALRGGVAVMKATDLSQVIVNAVDDTTRVIGRNLDLYSEWGTASFSSKNGRTVFRLEGGNLIDAQRKDVSGFSLVVGESSDAYVDMKVFDTTGGNTVYMHRINRAGDSTTIQKKNRMDKVDGRYMIGATKGMRIIVGADMEIDADKKMVIRTPKLHLGGTEKAEPAVMGGKLVSYLKKIVNHINSQLAVMTPAGMSTPGAMIPMPDVDAILSNTVFLVD